MTPLEKREALEAIVTHWGMPVLIEELEKIVSRVENGVMSVPLDKDPEKAALSLYAERMKAEGANAVIKALVMQVQQWKTSVKESRK